MSLKGLNDIIMWIKRHNITRVISWWDLGICWRTWGRGARPVTLGIGWLCAFHLRVRVQRQVGTVGTIYLGKVPGLLDHVGSAGGKVCSQSSSAFGSWAFPAGILRFDESGTGQVYTGSCPRCRCWDANVHMLLTDQVGRVIRTRGAASIVWNTASPGSSCMIFRGSAVWLAALLGA